MTPVRRPTQQRFRLYVAGQGRNSLLAIANLREYCERAFPGHHEVELVDVTRESSRALADGIILTPTLKRISPKPERAIVGNLSDLAALGRELGIAERS